MYDDMTREFGKITGQVGPAPFHFHQNSIFPFQIPQFLKSNCNLRTTYRIKTSANVYIFWSFVSTVPKSMYLNKKSAFKKQQKQPLYEQPQKNDKRLTNIVGPSPLSGSLIKRYRCIVHTPVRVYYLYFTFWRGRPIIITRWEPPPCVMRATRGVCAPPQGHACNWRGLRATARHACKLWGRCATAGPCRQLAPPRHRCSQTFAPVAKKESMLNIQMNHFVYKRVAHKPFGCKCLDSLQSRRNVGRVRTT